MVEPIPPSVVDGAPTTKPPCRICDGFKNYVKTESAKTPSSTAKKSTAKKVATPQTPPMPCPPDSYDLGSSTWTFLHTMAAYYPEAPSEKEQRTMTKFFRTFSKVYPCSHCAEHLRGEMKKNPPKVQNNRLLNLWLCGVHNEVNVRLGKPVFDCSNRNGTEDASLQIQSKIMSASTSKNVVPMKTDDDKTEQAAVAPVEDEKTIAAAEIKQNLALLERSVQSGESRFITRALRSTASLRKKLTPEILRHAISTNLPKGHPMKTSLLAVIESTDSMEVDAEPTTTDAKTATAVIPEVEVYFGYLVLIHLHDKKEVKKGAKLSTELVEKVRSVNRRALDQIAAKIYFYYERFYEVTGKLADVRPILLAAQRTATLRHDDETQATLINLLLRNYLHYNLYDQADKLVSKAAFPETAGNNQQARYLYYLGRIKAIQLDYTASHQHLLQAIRKAPENPKTAGFQQAVNKLAIIVQLLTGEIPERSVFRQATLRKPLVPYFHITQAVRVGDLTKFQETLGKYEKAFRADKTYTLILRLRHNVIKTGVRMISLSYSRISLRDICVKLQLDSEEDAEYIVAKAIRDGVIDASIDHEKGYMKSNEILDVYSTTEPQSAFHQRISFCLNLHNESVKAMRFPFSSHGKELASANAIREEERKLATEIIDGDLEDDEMEEF
ncbi:26S proteasome non-ATPase regulatory subunit [Irineochytrium annulatum]|nr:26S proteasome non-ATPase regulatory subunit [Irineochytrium annulatum]